jgi:hypothetical protein
MQYRLWNANNITIINRFLYYFEYMVSDSEFLWDDKIIITREDFDYHFFLDGIGTSRTAQIMSLVETMSTVH